MFRRKPKIIVNTVTLEQLEDDSTERKRKPDSGASHSTLFSKKHKDCGGDVTQTVNVNIVVNEDQESDIVGCFRACFGFAGRAGRGASGA